MKTNDLTEKTKIKRKPNILTSTIEDQTIMMDLEQGNYYDLNIVGSRIWDLIEKEISVKDICSILLSEYNVEEKHCKMAVITFLKEMQKEGIISVS
jgi:hypothetical protein